MRITNPWGIGYLQRSYQQIKTALVAALPTEVTDRTESNPLVILISMFAGLTEHLNYYIDSMAQEMFVSTARLFSSLVKLGNFLDYYSQGSIGAYVTIHITLDVPSTLDWNIASGTVFKAADGTNRFITQKLYTIKAGITEFDIEARNIIPGSTLIVGIANNTANQTFKITDSAYTNKSANITIPSDTWIEVDTLAFSKSNDKHYQVRLNTDGALYVIFGDGVNGKIPVSGNVTLNYAKTSGQAYNNIGPGIITICETALLALTTGPTTLTITNPSNPNGGSDLETSSNLKTRIPKSLRTLDRAVTYQDYYDLLQLTPGVEKGEVDFCCSNAFGVILYVIPHGGGIAGSSLLNDVSIFFDYRKILGVKTTPRAAGELKIIILVNAVIYSGEVVATTNVLILNTLKNNYNYLNQGINQSVRISDITSLIDNLIPVDYVKSLIINCKPYAKPINNSHVLNFACTILSTAIEKVVYSVIYQGSSNWLLSRANIALGTYVTAATFLNTEISFVISAGTYTTGDEFDFTVYPYNKDIEITDFTIPTLDASSTTASTRETDSIRNKNC